ncbi:Hypothetical predicted protein [Olea europaea subsp. europaea]|uniref:DUF1985 domain-containing protein n=1 Tax=Olea europaea subsp. europaea TaxID=158383 RepID=A0A8S0S097_OLEEU|nr:Hypothetical predicted protein [Olea europaea subsp. europaea]
MDHFHDRLRDDFRNCCLGFLADVLEIQFPAQLIQALGHLTQFGLQKYAIVTRLHTGSFKEGDRYRKALEKRRLQEKYFKSQEKISCAQLEKTFVRVSTPRADRYKLDLALIVEGVIIAPDNNVGIDEDTFSLVDDLELFFSYPWAKVGYRRLLKGFQGTWARKMSDAKMKNQKDVSYTIHRFSIAIQIWAYETVLEFGKRFDEWLHVHATLHPTEAERDLPYITSLVPFSDRPVQFLNDLARSVVRPQFHEAAPASGGHEGSAVTPEGNGDDGSKADDSGDSGHDTSSETGGGDIEDNEDASGWQLCALPTPMVVPHIWAAGYMWWTDYDEGERGGHVVRPSHLFRDEVVDREA